MRHAVVLPFNGVEPGSNVCPAPATAAIQKVEIDASRPASGSASSSSGTFKVSGLDETAQHALREVSVALIQGDPDAMTRAGERGRVVDGTGRLRFLSNSKEEEVLCWAARTFASRKHQEKSVDCDISFIEGGKAKRGGLPKLTTESAKKAERALCDAISRGDGDSMVRCAGHVVGTWGIYHAELPRLRALTWAARVLGERWIAGSFPTPSLPPSPPNSGNSAISSASTLPYRHVIQDDEPYVRPDSARRYQLGLPQLD